MKIQLQIKYNFSPKLLKILKSNLLKILKLELKNNAIAHQFQKYKYSKKRK